MQIQTDSRNTFNGNLRGIDIENRVERLVRLLNLQLYSYPELGYQIGLNYVAAVIQSVFK